MKWYQKPGWIIILLIVFFPAGIYLMWRYTRWNRVVKIVVTAILAVFVISSFGKGNDASVTDQTTMQSTSTTQKSTTEQMASTTIPTTLSTTASSTTITTIATTILETTKSTTSSTTKAPTVKPTTANPTTTVIKPSLLSMTTPISPGENATLSIKGKPNTVFDINVYYSTVKSTATGLENKTSDANGNVSWTWKVGAGTNSGNYHIDIIGGGSTLVVNFTVK